MLYIRHSATEEQLSALVPACSSGSETEKWNMKQMKYSAPDTAVQFRRNTANMMSINYGFLLLVRYLNS